jgi:hypothetical protein
MPATYDFDRVASSVPWASLASLPAGRKLPALAGANDAIKSVQLKLSWRHPLTASGWRC